MNKEHKTWQQKVMPAMKHKGLINLIWRGVIEELFKIENEQGKHEYIN